MEESSGNIFADLGFPNPEREEIKARLTLQIYRLIKQRGLTQTQAGEVLGIKQPHVRPMPSDQRTDGLVAPLRLPGGRVPPGP